MITEIRKNFKVQGVRVLLLITVVTLIGGGLTSLFFKDSRQREIAIIMINNNSIGKKEFERKVNYETERIGLLRQQLGSNADAFLRAYNLDNPQQLALQSLVQEELLNQVAHKLGITLSTDFIIKKLKDPAFVVQELGDLIPLGVLDANGAVNESFLYSYLERYKFPVQEFEKEIENKLRRKMIMDIISSTAFVSDADVRSYFRHEYSHKKFSIATFSFDTYLKKEKLQEISADELKIFYEQENKATKRYWIPEKRLGSLWIFNPHSYGIIVSPQEIELYYGMHKAKKFIETPLQVQVRRILFKVDENADQKKVQAVQAHAQKIKEELTKDPKQFAALASKYSDDKESAKAGGLVPYFKKGEKDSVLEVTALRLKNDGDISDLISTVDGLEIIQRVGRKPAVYKPLDKVKKNVEDLIIKQKFQVQFNDDLNRISAQQKNKPTAFADFARQKGAIQQPLEGSKDNETPAIQRLFKLKKDDLAFYIDAEQQGAVVILNDINKTSENPVDKVKNIVREDVYKAKALAAFKNDLRKAKDMALKGNIDALKELGAIVIRTDFLGKNDKEKLGSLVKKGINVNRLFALDRVGAVFIEEQGNQGYCLKYEAVEPVNEEELISKRTEIVNELDQSNKSLIGRGFIASLYRNATIKTTELVTNY